MIGLIDTDGDGQITEAEVQAYGRHVFDDITVDIDEQSYSAVPSKALFPPMLNLTSGVGVIHVEATLVSDGTAVSGQTRDESQQTLRVDYSIAASVGAIVLPAPTRTPVLGAMPEQERAVLDALAEPSQSPAVLLV